MALVQLPAELLLRIFRYVGSSFFYDDVSRLLVSKRWYEFALEIFSESLMLSFSRLHRMMSLAPADAILRYEEKLVTLELCFSPDLNYKPQPRPISTCSDARRTSNAAEGPQEVDCAEDNEDGEDIEIPEAAAEALYGAEINRIWDYDDGWEQLVDKTMAKLVMLMQKAGRLRSLRLRFDVSQQHPWAMLELHHYLIETHGEAMLSARRLRVVVLDLPGRFDNPERHMCPAIAAQLGKLSVLHVRMDCICPSILEPPPDAPARLRLRELVVNLALPSHVGGFCSDTHTKNCSTRSDWRFMGKDDVQEDDMRPAAEALAQRMGRNATVRILTHDLSGSDDSGMLSLDVVTGRTMIIPRDAPWTADGPLFQEQLESGE